jgi:chorismate lyase
MSIAYLTDEDIRKLDRDLRILVATNGILTRTLGVVSNDEIVVQLIKQQVHPISTKIPEFRDLAVDRVLDILGSFYSRAATAESGAGIL